MTHLGGAFQVATLHRLFACIMDNKNKNKNTISNSSGDAMNQSPNFSFDVCVCCEQLVVMCTQLEHVQQVQLWQFHRQHFPCSYVVAATHHPLACPPCSLGRPYASHHRRCCTPGAGHSPSRHHSSWSHSYRYSCERPPLSVSNQCSRSQGCIPSIQRLHVGGPFPSEQRM